MTLYFSLCLQEQGSMLKTFLTTVELKINTRQSPQMFQTMCGSRKVFPLNTDVNNQLEEVQDSVFIIKLNLSHYTPRRRLGG
jgi:hypothetical protein